MPQKATNIDRDRRTATARDQETAAPARGKSRSSTTVPLVLRREEATSFRTRPSYRDGALPENPSACIGQKPEQHDGSLGFTSREATSFDRDRRTATARYLRTQRLRRAKAGAARRFPWFYVARSDDL